MKPAAGLLLALGLLLGGCASVEGTLDRGRSFTGVQRFFVVSNTNDNHAIDHRIAEALRARGREAETGPRTMLPDNAQAVVTFTDRWAWDFADHIVYLRIDVRDPQADFAYASATFDARVPSRDTLPEIVSQLVDRLMAGKKK